MLEEIYNRLPYKFDDGFPDFLGAGYEAAEVVGVKVCEWLGDVDPGSVYENVDSSEVPHRGLEDVCRRLQFADISVDDN